MEEQRKELLSLAEQVATAGFGITLDYSDASIKHIDFMLNELHDEFVTTKDYSGLDGVALEFTAYIVAVIEKNHEKGTWSKDHSDFGKDSYPFSWSGTTLFPYAWCTKQIIDGSGESVLNKYEQLVLAR